MPLILALFEKRIAGDDCLMELARRRFRQANLGAEMYAGTPEQLEWNLQFRPSPETPVMVHLARELNLFEATSRARLVEFASRFAGRVNGLVLHDSTELASRSEEYVRAACDLQAQLERGGLVHAPIVFIEYASGLDPALFAGFFHAIRSLPQLSVCIDVGHVGIQAARRAYEQLHPGEDVCLLKHEPAKLPRVIADVESAVRAALPTVLELIEALPLGAPASWRRDPGFAREERLLTSSPASSSPAPRRHDAGAPSKPVHFHLHDGHPLSTFSPFGVSDHLSFLAALPPGFDHGGKRALPLMFGPEGLAKILRLATRVLGARNVSFTLEIHPTAERLPLDNAEQLFSRWTDKTNAEQMNRWLEVLRSNAELLAKHLPKPAR